MKIVRIIVSIILSAVLCGLLLILFMMIIPNYKAVETVSNTLGETAGGWVGTAVGTYIGVTEEAQHGWDDGKEQGLSAEDTEMEIINSIVNLGSGKLEVLSADIKINNDVKIAYGYYALYVKYGKIIFKVDLDQADFNIHGNTLKIRIPYPVAEVYIDDSKPMEIIAEYEQISIIDRGEDAIKESINSAEEIIKNTVEKVDNYEYLYEQAKNNAKERITELALESTCGIEVVVEFMGDEYAE